MLVVILLGKFSTSLAQFTHPKEGIQSNMDECHDIQEFVLNSDQHQQGKQVIECNDLYHHYNAHAWKEFQSPDSEIKIGSYNIWNLGSNQTRFKDLELNAKMLNQWDIIAVSELVRTTSTKRKTNLAIRMQYDSGELTQEEASFNYHRPGYIDLLLKLQEVSKDPSWALIIAPYAQSKSQEMVGFYYRASKVKPKKTPYCQSVKQWIENHGGVGTNDLYGCSPELDSQRESMISRKPFIASFYSNNFDFTYLGAHLIFNSPNPETLEEMSQKILATGEEEVDTYFSTLSSQYKARFTELKIILEVMKEISDSSSEKDIILGADFNLENKLFHRGKFDPWSEVLKAYPGAMVYNDLETSVSVKLSQKGLSNNYDHFVFNPSSASECLKNNSAPNLTVFYFHKDDSYKPLDSNDPSWDDFTPYLIDSDQEEKIALYLQNLKMKIEQERYIQRNELAPLEEEEISAILEMARRNLFKTQLREATHFEVFKQLYSDHYPIYMNCSTEQDDD